MERFGEDVASLTEGLSEREEEGVKKRLDGVRRKLIDLYRRNLVKINHSVMEMLCAKHLIVKGYDIEVERQLNEVLVCDLYAVRGDGNVIVEIETGFVPPDHALEPGSYNRARIASKIARYSNFSNKFGLGTPSNNILQINPVFLVPPKYRRLEDVLEVKALCDRYYKRPPVDIKEIRNARLNAVYIIDVDNKRVQEVDPGAYFERVTKLPLIAGGLS